MIMTSILRDKPLPLFIVAGMPRGATTFLYHYLSQHPDIFLPFRKEVNYFSTNYERGLDWYHSLYSGMKEELIAGDISPPCFLDEGSIDRIKKYNSNAKIILVVRNPAEWAVSFYHQFKSFSYDVPTLEEYLIHGYRSKIGDQHLDINFSGSWITDRIRKFQDEFGKNILIYDFSYFKENPLSILKQLENFLSIRDYFTAENFDNRRINESRRRNVRFISWILSREKAISFIAKMLPRSTIVFLRSIFDRFSTKTSGESSKRDTHDEREILLAMKYLENQVNSVNLLFRESRVLIGNRPVRAITDETPANF